MTLGSVISPIQMGTSLIHSTPVCLVWREFGGLNLDQWVLGNGKVSISDQLRCLVCLVWREFGGLNLDQWILGNGQVSISDQFRCDMDVPEAKL